MAAFLFCGVFISFSIQKVRSNYLFNPKKQRPRLYEVATPDITIKEGYISQKKEVVKIYRNGKVAAEVKLGPPIMVAQADKEEKWGFFQFPGIGRTDDGTLVVGWQMNEDSHKAYGKGVSGKRMSKDEGDTWEVLDKDVFVKGTWCVPLKCGDMIQILTPSSKSVNDYSYFPNSICRDQSLKMDFYLESDLPEDLRGMYLNVRKKHDGSFVRIHGELDDPGLLRYSIDGMMPLMWWGEIKELVDGSLVAGIYRCYYEDSKGGVPKSGITFYKSEDVGHHWTAIGKIPYDIDEINDKARKYDSTRGFSEASFVILKDSTFLCVMRTGYNTPMYKSFSYDGGQHWTPPIIIAPNGVKPKLLLLDNGILVLASGRPGLQLRFCVEGDGNVWSEPIEMLPFMDNDGSYDIWSSSCGYPAILQVDANTFYIAYSIFNTKNSTGERRKSIFFRKVSVIK